MLFSSTHGCSLQMDPTIGYIVKSEPIVDTTSSNTCCIDSVCLLLALFYPNIHFIVYDAEVYI